LVLAGGAGSKSKERTLPPPAKFTFAFEAGSERSLARAIALVSFC
jgi:hypothetical protein